MSVLDYRRSLNRILRRSKHVFLMGHRDLDLDALGSALGMCSILRNLRKHCSIIIDDKEHELGVQKVLEETEGSFSIIESKEIQNYLHRRTRKNLLILVDVNKKNILQNKEILNYFSNIVILDHHEIGENTVDATLSIIDTNASSTCEMIAELVEYYSIEMDPYICTVLLSGIVLDTNNFTLKTKAETYECAHFLTTLGADPEKVQYLLKQDLEDYMERQKLLTNCEIIDGKYAVAKGNGNTIYRREDLAKIADTLLFFNHIEASFVVGKLEKNVVGISARSFQDFKVHEVLEKLGGGGEKNIAAARIENATVADTTKKLKKYIKEQGEKSCK